MGLFSKKTSDDKSSGNAQQRWQSKALGYAQAVNAYVARGMREGWDAVGDEPQDEADAGLAQAAIKAVVEANRAGQTEQLREQWPPMHHLLMPLLKDNGQNISAVFVLEDGSFVARIGAPYELGRVIQVRDDQVQTIEGFSHMGRSPDRRYFAYAREEGIEITEGWLGLRTSLCRWPTGLEGVPEGFAVNPLQEKPTPTKLIPLTDGQRALLVSSDGIWVLSAKEAVRLLPTTESMKEHFEWSQQEYPDDELTMDLSMEHGEVSPDGCWIAAGGQDSKHLIFDAQLQLQGNIGHASEYPHYALFSSDSQMAIFNSCHFYNGETIAVQMRDLPLTTNAYDEHEKTPTLESGARVYAAVHRTTEHGGQFIIGDASGYLRAFDHAGQSLWQHHLGSSFSAIDVSTDGKTLYAATYAGFISIMTLDAGHQRPCQIGNGNHFEQRRWLFWKKQPQPLIW
jgi:hypothetical protein